MPERNSPATGMGDHPYANPICLIPAPAIFRTRKLPRSALWPPYSV